MNISKRRVLILGFIAIAAIVALTFLAAPNSNNEISSGSTFGRNPDGYGAWYEYMSERGTPVERWQKPFRRLIKNQENGDITYIQIRSKEQFQQSKLLSYQLSELERNWLKQGNTLVIVGEMQPSTAAPFSSILRSEDLKKIKIETTRRKKANNQTNTLLKDDFGQVVWSENIGEGKLIYISTPYLATNAYQEFPDNYEFLAQLVSKNHKIFVDEYIHGYKDKETIAREAQTNLWNYLAQTPLLLLFIQLLIIILIAIAVAFRRFGQPVSLKTSVVDNSMAYIQALAGVLEKAECTDFVVETIGKDEQRKLQKSLGLGQTLVEKETLITAWTKQTGKPATELSQLLQVSQRQNRFSESELITWLEKWQKINS
ncbi:MAG: DUF4350 domain-containing protein [Pleurocapsa sp.]